MRWKVGLVLITTLFVTSSQAQAEGGQWILRGRAILVSPNDSSTTIGDTGTSASVGSAVVPEFDLTYMIDDRWGLELIAATSNHDLGTVGGALGGLSAGDVWALPPTLTVQYHLGDSESTHVYLGAGINYTLFYSYSLSDDLEAAGVSNIGFDSSFGLAGQIGLNVVTSEKWHLNFDLKYISMSTVATLELADGGVLDTLDVDINPWVLGIGVGYRF